jgi:penicillin amidase
MTSVDGTDSIAKQALTLLRAWDGDMDRGRPEPLLFMMWLRSLNHALYADELGPLSTDYAGLHPQVVTDILTKNDIWCDDVTTRDTTESCAEILSRSLQTALEKLSADHGVDIDRWRWGSVHRAELAHPFLDRIPLLKEIIDIGIETDGGNYTVNRGASYAGPIDDEPGDNAFAHRHGPGLRAIYDLSDLDNSRFMISTGQSGNPMSPYYNHFVQSWRDGGYISLSGDRERLLHSALGVLVLQP